MTAAEPVPGWQLAAIVREATAALARLYPERRRPAIEAPPRLIDASVDPVIARQHAHKVAHATEAHARDALHDAHGNVKRGYEGCAPYECPHCGLWHVGHPSPPHSQRWEPGRR